MIHYCKYSYDNIEALCLRIFAGYGFSLPDCQAITDALLAADLAGIESHGIQRLMRYHKAILEGEVHVHAVPVVQRETLVSATIHAHSAMGQLVSKSAMELAIKKARNTGIGIVAVHHSNHYGIAGYYTRMAVESDMIGLCMTNTEAIMVPTFGRQPMLGTNPIAVSMPADPTPFLFDAATTVVPRGKLEVCAKKGQELPEGWAIDETGGGATDTQLVLSNILHKAGGGILPLGGWGEDHSGHKGYGFGLVCELFTSLIAGGDPSNHAVAPGKNELSHSFWAIDHGIFGDKAGIRERMSRFLQELRDSPKAEGFERIYIHGEKELESEQVNRREGLPVNSKTWGELRVIALELGVDSAPFIGTSFQGG